MSNTPLTVVAEIKAKPGCEEEVKNILLGLIAPTHAEDGCIDYDMHQSEEDPSSFLFYENWVSKESLDQHLNTPHLNAFKAKAEDVLSEPVKITLWRRQNEPKPLTI